MATLFNPLCPPILGDFRFGGHPHPSAKDWQRGESPLHSPVGKQSQPCLLSQKTAAKRVNPIKNRKIGIFVCIQNWAWLADGEVVRLGSGVSLGVRLGVGVMTAGVGVDKRGDVVVSVGVSGGVGAGVGVGVTDGRP